MMRKSGRVTAIDLEPGRSGDFGSFAGFLPGLMRSNPLSPQFSLTNKQPEPNFLNL